MAKKSIKNSSAVRKKILAKGNAKKSPKDPAAVREQILAKYKANKKNTAPAPKAISLKEKRDKSKDVAAQKAAQRKAKRLAAKKARQGQDQQVPNPEQIGEREPDSSTE